MLLSDAADGPGWPVKDIALALGVTARTVEHLKKRFVEEGLDCALDRRPEAKPRAVRLDGEFEARLIALACTEPPAGRARWTVRLLADKAVELSIADSVSPMTVCNTLKKPTSASPLGVLEDPARRERGLRSRDGGRAGGLRAPL